MNLNRKMIRRTRSKPKKYEMTVKSLEIAREVVEEAGPENIDSVWQYTTPEGDPENYAIFMRKQYVDIYNSSYCLNPQLLFLDREWLKGEER